MNLLNVASKKQWLGDPPAVREIQEIFEINDMIPHSWRRSAVQAIRVALSRAVSVPATQVHVGTSRTKTREVDEARAERAREKVR